ncbi:thioesterase family protein [Pseudomonas sp. UM16]|uniref:thioesterase family protein n=1 Tax=Pseudomonas sp. UM16 TaxID=3158962 RepID=UPI0039902404
MPALITYQTPVQADWVDYNGHLRDAFYLLIFSYATDGFMDRIGLDSDNRSATGNSLFTLECHLNYLHEVKLGSEVWVQTQVIGFDRKRLHLYHSLHRADFAEVLAASEQMLLHVDLAGPRSAPFTPSVVERLQGIVDEQVDLPAAEFVGRVIGLAPMN